MSPPNSRLAYTDCYDIMNAAIKDGTGARVEVESENHGINLRMRIQYARRIDRLDNRMTYAADSPLYGRSVYDPLVMRLKQIDDCWWVYLEVCSIGNLNIQGLSEVPHGASIEPEPDTESELEGPVEPIDTDVELPEPEPLRRI